MTTPALREALSDAISSGKFVDTKIVLFSRRDNAGRICKPRSLYANSHVLRTVPYFEDLLFGTFAEAENRDFSEDDGNELAEDYGYSSDSDLEEDYGYSSNSDLEEDWDFKIPGSVGRHTASPRQQEIPHDQYEEDTQSGKVIKVHDVAFITFQAFLVYLYTNYTNFAPFGSDENRKGRSAEIAWTPEGDIPKPSPKSIYRLADKYDLPELKTLALDHIQRNLTSCDPVREAFSVFTSRYDEIRTVQVHHLLSVLSSGSSEISKTIHKDLDERIESYTAGELKHARETIALIWKTSRKPRDIDITSVPLDPERTKGWARFLPKPEVARRPEPGVRTSLIKSIQGRSLLHRRYWARTSRGGRICPIYFPNIVPDSTLSQIIALVERLNTRDGRLEKDQEHELPEDSDYESENELKDGSITSRADHGENWGQKLLPVLKVGSLAAWRSLLVYLCTGEIRFAPLTSQGSDTRSRWKRENTRAASLAPCSPKTIYSLAKRLQITALADLAFKDIERKINQENVISETFSKFASQYSEIIAMGWKRLDAQLEKEKATELIQELIQKMAEGNAVHQTDGLRFGLYNALRQRGMEGYPFAQLRCSHRRCANHSRPVSYTDLDNGICRREPLGWGSWAVPTAVMECTECGHVRTDQFTWCKGCRRIFR